MNKEKKNESTSTDSDCSKTGYKRTTPKCKRCERHGVKNVELKGHKRYCAYQNCGCLICHVVVAEQKLSARNIAMKRALKNEEKEIAPEEIPPMPWFLTNFKKYGFHVLTNYTLQEIQKSGFTVLRDPSKMWYILASLNKCAYDLDAGIKNNAALEFAANISQAIIRQLKISRRNIVQNITFSFIIIYLIYFPFLFKYNLLPP
ncbi:protein doublesex-like [Temnothorax curvispinosus]|uniref:Protein doublesex-like n=1 Tax=Temnothorax curvispinosus TaxID=300111 RepID=A0A6J1RC21_9HYME|nr:protein doublesex-like [Temnothorax curvispinosus]